MPLNAEDTTPARFGPPLPSGERHGPGIGVRVRV